MDIQDFKIILIDKNLDIVEEYKKVSGKNVTTLQGNILLLDVEAVVSPANSFGRMNGGIDYWYTQFFGTGLQIQLQKEIHNLWKGELPVGKAIVVPTNHFPIKYLVSAPTMRTPQVLPSGSINAYLACKAALEAAHISGIKSIAIPGLGTGVGGMAPKECASQVQQAIIEFERDYQ
jgi:O-acetyl-ADP-ribose deacetylase (regulator of RNase III)